MTSQCQRCTRPATLHITEVLQDNQFEELHLCEECAQQYFHESEQKVTDSKEANFDVLADEEISNLNSKSCSHCGLQFGEFRHTGRLGCPYDYEVFREQLTLLLDNIHGETHHCGKIPQRQPREHQVRMELTQLRKQLQRQISCENYEEAARTRDRIRELELGSTTKTSSADETDQGASYSSS